MITIMTPGFSKVFVAHSCLGSQTTSPRLFPPVSEVYVFIIIMNDTTMTYYHHQMNDWRHLETGIVNKADCHQIGRVLSLEKVEHLISG